MFTKEQVAQWEADGVDVPEFWKTVAVDKPTRIVPIKKRILVTSVTGPKKVFPGKRFIFKVTQFNRNDFVVGSIASKIKWGYSVDGGGIVGIAQTGKAVAGKLEVQLDWQVPAIKGRVVTVYAWLERASEGASSSAEIITFPFYFNRYKLKGLNSDLTGIASDLCYGDGVHRTAHFAYTKQQIEDLGTLMEISMGFDNNHLFDSFTNMVDTFFTSDPDLKKVAFKMIDRFKKSTGQDFSDPILTKAAINHPSTKEFCKKIESGIQNILKINKGDVTSLSTNEISLDSRPYGRPQFGTSDDTTDGLKIMINDIWSYEVIIDNFETRDNNYSITYRIILWDNFGLDYPDLEKTLNYLQQGFRSWFVLQHYKSFRPFINKMEFKKTFKGNILVGGPLKIQ